MPSRDVIRRRRLTALAVLAGVSSLIGIAVGSSGEDEGLRAERPPALTTTAADAAAAPSASSRAALERLAGSAVILRFRGTTAPAYVTRALRRHRAAGVILFRDNVVSRPQLRAMTAAFHRAAGGRAIVMLDQEGGAIRNVPWAPPREAPPTVTSTAEATATARATAAGLRDVGVTVNLAPVADVASVPGSVMRSRAFSSDARTAARLVDATVRGYGGSRVLPTVKHFPGLGRARGNTDFAQVTAPGRGELTPFASAIAAGAPVVMTSHALYPDLDPNAIASQSRRIVTGLLRDRLGFKGVIVTDSMEAKAVVTRMSTPAAAVRALAAGHDLILTTGRGSYLPVLRALAAGARRDKGFERRLREAVARVDALRRRLR